MKLLPIPLNAEHIEGTKQHWLPLLERVSRGCTGEDLGILAQLVNDRLVQVVLAWDEENNRARALVGVRYVMRGKERVAEIIWSSDRFREEFEPLLSELEQFLRDMDCQVCRPIPRMALTKMLARNGYKATHMLMEKNLWDRHPAAPRSPSK